MELLSGFGKCGPKLNLLTKPADILDTEYLSKYFVIQEFSPKFTAGKNSISFNGSSFLKRGSEIQVECTDSDGNYLYIESANEVNIVYKETSYYVLSVHVYDEISNGPGKLVLYGNLITGETVKWVGNIIIDKTLENTSKVRFYNKPYLEIFPILSPVLSTVGSSFQILDFSGSFYSYAITPQKDTNKINKRNEDIDYRIFFKNFTQLNTEIFQETSTSFNNQMDGWDLEIRNRFVQTPYSYTNTLTNTTASYKIKKVINNTSLKLDDVITHQDSNKNDIVVNVSDGDFYIRYPYISYNTASENSNYLRADTSYGPIIVKKSYINVFYRNLKTFSGFVARHKLYRKSLFSPGDFEVIADEPLNSYELLQDRLTINKMFDKIGTFYNKKHIDRYIFSSDDNIQLSQTSDQLLNGLSIRSKTTCNLLNSINSYLIIKDNTSYLERTSNYLPYDNAEFLSMSGSSYDSNFIELKKDVTYCLSANVILEKDSTTIHETDAGLEFYFTSSLSDINKESGSVYLQSGLMKIGRIPIYEQLSKKVFSDKVNIFFNVNHDLYGTLMMVPKKCNCIISNLSLKPYGDHGFSPDVLMTKIQFPINIPNESFEIKAELFDVNSNLIYSDLRTIVSPDVSGSSLFSHIFGFKDPNKIDYLSGSLVVAGHQWVYKNSVVTGSFLVKGAVTFENLTRCNDAWNYKRLVGWDQTSGVTCFTDINDITHTDNNTINISLFEPNQSTKTTYRLIPSVEGRNVFVPKVILR